jgi:hypothetical protein
MASVVKEMHQRARRQQQEWQEWHKADEVRAMFGDEEVPGNNNEAEEHPFRYAAVPIRVAGS